MVLSWQDWKGLVQLFISKPPQLPMIWAKLTPDEQRDFLRTFPDYEDTVRYFEATRSKSTVNRSKIPRRGALPSIDLTAAVFRGARLNNRRTLREYLHYLRTASSMLAVRDFLVVCHGFYTMQGAQTFQCPSNVVMYQLARPGQLLHLDELRALSRYLKDQGRVDEFLTSPDRPNYPDPELNRLEKKLILPGDTYKDKLLWFGDPNLIMGVFTLPLRPDFDAGTMLNTMPGVYTGQTQSINTGAFIAPHKYASMSVVADYFSKNGGGFLVFFNCRETPRNNNRPLVAISMNNATLSTAHLPVELSVPRAYISPLDSLGRPAGFKQVSLPSWEQEFLRITVERGTDGDMEPGVRNGAVYQYIGSWEGIINIVSRLRSDSADVILFKDSIGPIKNGRNNVGNNIPVQVLEEIRAWMSKKRYKPENNANTRQAKRVKPNWTS